MSNHCSDVAQGKRQCATLGNPIAVDTDGLLVDVEVQSIKENWPTYEDKIRDVDHFFSTAITKEVNGKLKKYRPCNLCPWVFRWSIQLCTLNETRRNDKNLIDEVTTMWWHLEASHSVHDISLFMLFQWLIILLGKVSHLGKGCQLPVKATRRHQKAQGDSSRRDPYSGPSSYREEVELGCPLLRQAVLTNSSWVACHDRPSR